jgi:hypothetical protein
MPDSTLSTLQEIRARIRRLIRSPSVNQISDADIDSYVNTFMLYDFPESLRLFYLRTTVTFYTKPYVDTYATDTTDVLDPLYNFKNQYISTHGPIYIAGYQAYFTQSREQFFGVYPMTSSIASIGTGGDGITMNFAGVLSAIPVLANNVTFSSIDANNNGLVLKDDGNGNLVAPYSPAATGTIDYVTGVYTLDFPAAPAMGATINSQTVPYVPARPLGVCYYDNKFILRAVPDQPYPVVMEVYRRPLELLDSADLPELAEWSQYISYGASVKIAQERMDPDSVQILATEFDRQERMILRRTLVQQTNERTATIYTEQSSIGTIGNGLGWGGGNF